MNDERWELICPPYGYLLLADEVAIEYGIRLLQKKLKESKEEGK